MALALVATASGLIASVFAVSRMLAMLTDMKMIPHSHFGMQGTIKDHTLVYTVVIAGFLTVFFDLSRIASLGAFFYLVMDMIIHFGVFRHLREEIGAQGWVLLTAIALDAVGAGRFRCDEVAVRPAHSSWSAFLPLALVFLFVRLFLARNPVGGRRSRPSLKGLSFQSLEAASKKHRKAGRPWSTITITQRPTSPAGTETAKDPVCGMTVAVKTDGRYAAFQGETFHFCSDKCQTKFKADPWFYASGRAAGQKKAAPANVQYTCPMHPEIVRGCAGGPARSAAWRWNRWCPRTSPARN